MRVPPLWPYSWSESQTQTRTVATIPAVTLRETEARGDITPTISCSGKYKLVVGTKTVQSYMTKKKINFFLYSNLGVTDYLLDKMFS